MELRFDLDLADAAVGELRATQSELPGRPGGPRVPATGIGIIAPVLERLFREEYLLENATRQAIGDLHRSLESTIDQVRGADVFRLVSR